MAFQQPALNRDTTIHNPQGIFHNVMGGYIPLNSARGSDFPFTSRQSRCGAQREFVAPSVPILQFQPSQASAPLQGPVTDSAPRCGAGSGRSAPRGSQR